MNIVSFLDSNAVSIRYPGIVFHEIHPLYGRYPPYRPCSNKKADETLDRQTEKIRGGRDTLTHYIYPSFVPPNFIYANL